MVYDVIFINPPITEGKKKRFSFPPLGVLYIATFIKNKGFSVKFVDALVDGTLNKDLVQMVAGEKPLMVGLSAMTCQIINSIKIAEGIKSLNPEIKVVIGGPHISSTTDELYKFSDKFDFLIYKEGEYSFYELLKAIKNGAKNFNETKGLIYKNEGGTIMKNPPREPIEDVDSLPFPDLSLVDLKKYDSSYAKSKPLTAIMASRGCPFNCTFCDVWATHGKKLRFRSPKNIVDEIQHNRNKFSIKQFMVKDSTFTVNKEWVKEICNDILSRKLKLNWTCNTRVDMLDKDLLKLMKKAGCYMVMLGIESGSQKVLDNIKKGITIKQIEDCIKMCKEVGMDTTGYFMVGNPGDNERTIKKTIEFSKTLGLDFASFCVTMPYPNTEIYKWAVKNNLLKNKHWYMKKMEFLAGLSMLGYINLPELPVKRQIELSKKATKGFYLRPRYIFPQILKLRPDNIKRKFKSLLELIG